MPPAGFEPAHTAPEAVALSPELRGLGATGKTLHDRHWSDQTRNPPPEGGGFVVRGATRTDGTQPTQPEVPVGGSRSYLG